mmetsp:Transcript_5130/g.9697  ORF Transcript_5130/g.9697 Transcript_5130/m.9697 type:complete len:202 (+) Transcript_5130:341-946(+)
MFSFNFPLKWTTWDFSEQQHPSSVHCLNSVIFSPIPLNNEHGSSITSMLPPVSYVSGSLKWNCRIFLLETLPFDGCGPLYPYPSVSSLLRATWSEVPNQRRMTSSEPMVMASMFSKNCWPLPMEELRTKMMPPLTGWLGSSLQVAATSNRRRNTLRSGRSTSMSVSRKTMSALLRAACSSFRNRIRARMRDTMPSLVSMPP